MASQQQIVMDIVLVRLRLDGADVDTTVAVFLLLPERRNVPVATKAGHRTGQRFVWELKGQTKLRLPLVHSVFGSWQSSNEVEVGV